MEFSIKAGGPEQQRSACVVVGVFEPRKLSAAAAALDRLARGRISEIVRRGDMDGRSGAVLMLHNVAHLRCERVLLVGLGRERELRDKVYRDACRAALSALGDSGATDALVCLPEVAVGQRDTAWKVTQAVLIAADGSYRFERMKSKPAASRSRLRRLALSVPQRTELDSAERALQQGVAIGHGMALARDLGNLPGNVCTPTYLAEQALAVASRHNLKADVLETKDMEKLGMNTLLSVAKGSHQPPKFIVLKHNGGKAADKPVVLVGKGITFDTGGISLKPGADMDEMKFDMCGAASVLGALQACAELQLPINVVAAIPTTENMPGGRATKPGDIVTSLSGQTVEVLNTDAEGRLILCDALTYVERFEPTDVVDVATLTGACVIALGHVAAGLFANDDALARELLQAGDAVYDRAWQMPLWDDYQEQLKSNFADFANIGGRPAGSVTAACFLARFAKKYRWAHLDIAGIAWKSGKDKGATGRPVPLLTRFLIERARAAQAAHAAAGR